MVSDDGWLTLGLMLDNIRQFGLLLPSKTSYKFVIVFLTSDPVEHLREMGLLHLYFNVTWYNEKPCVYC